MSATASSSLADARRRTAVSSGLLLVCAAGATIGGRAAILAPIAAVLAVAAFTVRSKLRWSSLLNAIALVILFVPIRRYTMPGNLPFDLEPYRLLVMFVAAGWLLALLVDPTVRFRRSGLEAPLLVFMAAATASAIANPHRVSATSTEVTKSLMFLASFLLVFFMIVSLADRVEKLVKTLVAGGAVVGAFAVFESRTGFNVFDHLHSVIPLLELNDLGTVPARGARLRVAASAQHPIALGAALVMLLPLAAYLAQRTRQRRWWLAGALLVLGALATVSRTSILMLLVVGIVFLVLRPVQTKKLLPLLLPFIIAAHVALPGTLGSLKGAFFPHGGLVAEQATGAGTRGSGRLADVSPSLAEWAKQPVLGQGYGTRVVDRNKANASILDDQWLTTLLETGIVGVASLIWLFARSLRIFGRGARRDSGSRGWLLCAITASVAAYAVGMLTYDAFSFVQVTFLMFILLALGSVLATRVDELSLLDEPAAPA